MYLCMAHSKLGGPGEEIFEDSVKSFLGHFSDNYS